MRHKGKFDIFLYICPIIYLCAAIKRGFIPVNQLVAWEIIGGSTTYQTDKPINKTKIYD